MAYSEMEITRILKVGFETARKRRKNSLSVDKANILATLYRRETAIAMAKDYPDVQLEHMYVDNASMQLLRRASDFDVIVTENTFGDILSDEASMLAGSIGLVPSACLGNDFLQLRPRRKCLLLRRSLRTDPRRAAPTSPAKTSPTPSVPSHRLHDAPLHLRPGEGS